MKKNTYLLGESAGRYLIIRILKILLFPMACIVSTTLGNFHE